MIRLGCDVDGVLVDFNTAYVKLFQTLTGRDLFPSDWTEQLDKTFPTCWNYEKLAGYTSEEVKLVWDHIKADPDFWLHLDPYKETHAAICCLDPHAASDCDIYFITHRTGTRVKSQTEGWLLDIGFYNPTVLIAGDKIPIINSLELDAYIDDKPETVEQACADTKARIYLMDRPYNREVKVGERVGSVREMLEREGLWTV